VGWPVQTGWTESIDRQGQIALPEAGTITIDGLTIAQAQSAIQKALSTQFQGEHVEISLGRLRTVRVYVVGDVQRPGAYDVSSLSTPLSALYAAGGPTSRGSLRILRQYRGTQLVREIDLYDFLLHGVRSTSTACCRATPSWCRRSVRRFRWQEWCIVPRSTS
jgi:protein involved in polysaccharide export with SLBB domain